MYLLHIRECLKRIRNYTSAGKSAFLADTKSQDAVLRNLQTLTDSVGYLPAEIKARHPAVAWKAIAGLRNVLVHDYLGIDLNQVWDIVEKDLSSLGQQIEAILEEKN